jgi:phage gp29-like protein
VLAKATGPTLEQAVARRFVKALLAGEVPMSGLTEKTLPDDTPRNVRNHYGRLLTLDRIENVLRQANDGRMRGLTELSRESMELSGHLSSEVTKRMNRVAAGRVCVTPATGEDVDEDRAQEYADLVRAQIKGIPDWRSALIDIAWSAYDGRGCQEIAWAQRGHNRWTVTGLHWVMPMRLSFDRRRNLRVVDDRFETNGFQDVGFPVQEVPWKFLIQKPRLFGELPEREGLARRCIYWTFFGRFGTRERLILMEIFGKPWKVASGNDAEVQYGDDEITAANDTLGKLGGQTHAVMPYGFKLDLHSPPKGAGDVHKDVIDHAEQQLSKLVVGHENVSNSAPQGIGSGQAEAATDGLALIVASDWARIGDWLTQQLGLPIVVVNHGIEAAAYAPTITIEPMEGVPDPTKETERLRKALDLGIRVRLEEAYQRTGYGRPGDDEAYIVNVPGPIGADGAPGPLVPTVVYPRGEAPEPGELAPAPTAAPVEGAVDEAEGLALTPSSMEKVVTVNEARAAKSLDPLTLPDGSLDPDGDLTIPEFEAKRAAAAEVTGGAEGKDEVKTEFGEEALPQPPAPFGQAPEPGAAPPNAGGSVPPKPGAPSPIPAGKKRPTPAPDDDEDPPAEG